MSGKSSLSNYELAAAWAGRIEGEDIVERMDAFSRTAAAYGSLAVADELRRLIDRFDMVVRSLAETMAKQ